MARQPRYALPAQPQHIIQRGTNRSLVFAAADDYEFYRDCLAAACRRHGCALHAYVLMTNHVHLLMTPSTSTGISKTMHSVSGRYAQYFNEKYDRVGSFWESRYRSFVIDTDRYLLTCYRYVELNPVRAGIARDPAQYRWSSHHANAFGSNDSIVAPHALYLALDESAATRMLAYRELCQTGLDQQVLRDLRAAAHRGWALGSAQFRKDVSRRSRRRADPLPRGRRAIRATADQGLTADPRSWLNRAKSIASAMTR